MEEYGGRVVISVIYIYNVVSSYYVWGMVYYIVTDKLKRRPNAMIRVFHFLSLW